MGKNVESVWNQHFFPLSPPLKEMFCTLALMLSIMDNPNCI